MNSDTNYIINYILMHQLHPPSKPSRVTGTKNVRRRPAAHSTPFIFGHYFERCCYLSERGIRRRRITDAGAYRRHFRYCLRHRYGGAGRGAGQRGAAYHRRRFQHQPGVVDLDRQRLSAGDHHDVAVAVVAWRYRRLSPRLSGGTGAVYADVGGVRAGGFAADADAGAHSARAGGRGADERQHRADPVDLPQSPARARHGDQLAGGGGVHRRRADRRGGNSGRGVVAVAVRHQRAVRYCGAAAGLAFPAA